jgi:hypothetical protein
MKIEFSATIEVPNGTPFDDVEKWIQFELGGTCELKAGNAMSHEDLVSIGCKNIWIRMP